LIPGEEGHLRGLWLKNMKSIIDANVILRYILNANEAMSVEAYDGSKPTKATD